MRSTCSGFNDHISGPYGVLSVVVQGIKGQVVPEFSGSNQIVALHRDVMARLLGGDFLGRSVKYIALGDNTALATPGDTTIGSLTVKDLQTGANAPGGSIQAYMKEIDSIQFPGDGQVSFIWELGYDEANGLSVCDYGLVTGDNTLIARKARGTIEKTSEISIHGTWTLIWP